MCVFLVSHLGSQGESQLVYMLVNTFSLASGIDINGRLGLLGYKGVDMGELTKVKGR